MSPAMAAIKRRRTAALNEHAIMDIGDVWIGHVFTHLSLVDHVSFTRTCKYVYTRFQYAWPIDANFAGANYTALRDPITMPLFRLMRLELGFEMLTFQSEGGWIHPNEPALLTWPGPYIEWKRPFLYLNRDTATVKNHWHVRLYANYAFLYDGCTTDVGDPPKYYRLDVRHNMIHRTLFYDLLRRPSTPMQAVYVEGRTWQELTDEERAEFI